MKIKTLIKTESGPAVILERDILQQIDATPNSKFLLQIKNGCIVLKPLSDKDLDDLALQESDEISSTQSAVFKKLAES